MIRVTVRGPNCPLVTSEGNLALLTQEQQWRKKHSRNKKVMLCLWSPPLNYSSWSKNLKTIFVCIFGAFDHRKGIDWFGDFALSWPSFFPLISTDCSSIEYTPTTGPEEVKSLWISVQSIRPKNSMVNGNIASREDVTLFSRFRVVGLLVIQLVGNMLAGPTCQLVQHVGWSKIYHYDSVGPLDQPACLWNSQFEYTS